MVGLEESTDRSSMRLIRDDGPRCSMRRPVRTTVSPLARASLQMLYAQTLIAQTQRNVDDRLHLALGQVVVRTCLRVMGGHRHWKHVSARYDQTAPGRLCTCDRLL